MEELPSLKQEKEEEQEQEQEQEKQDQQQNETKTDDIITQISLQYLTLNNPNKISRNKNKQRVKTKDKLFYKKRILNTTRDLLNERFENLLYSPEIDTAFQNYIYLLINMFENIDKNDILQEEYKHLTEQEEETTTQDNLISSISVSKLDEELLMSNKKIHQEQTENKIRKANMENFTEIKKVSSHIDEKMNAIIPIKRKVNLKDPKLKMKNIPVGKRKNISINYEENTTISSSQQQTETKNNTETENETNTTTTKKEDFTEYNDKKG